MWSPSALAVACAWLVLRVMVLALCSLLLSSGPRCSTPWPVWTRGAAMQRDLAALVAVTAMACAWLVLLVAMLSRCVFFDCRQAPVAWHHGVLGQGCSLPVYATTGIMVQTVQKVRSSCSSWTRLWRCPLVCNIWCRRDSAITLAVPQLQFVAFYDRCRGADGARHRLEVPQLLFLVQVVDSPVVAQRQIPTVLVFRRLQRCPSCSTSTWWSTFLFTRSDAEFQLSFVTVEVPQNSSSTS